MSMFYAKSTGGFYTSDINGDNIPADAVEITVEEHVALGVGQSNDKRIVADANGKPVLDDRLPTPPEELAKGVRARRNVMLAATDSLVMRHRDELEEGAATTLSVDGYQALMRYRRELREITEQKGFPTDIHWPEMET